MSVGVKSVFKKFDPYPVIVNFQNGNLHTGEHNIAGGIYNNTNKNNKRTAVIALDNMLYIGEERCEDGFYNVIVKRNKKTGEISLIEVGNVHVKALSELEQKLVIEDKQPKDEPDDGYSLGEVFGSKRRKRVLEQSKKLKVDIDTMKEQLEKTVNENHIDAKEVSQMNDKPELETNQYAPPSNRSAEDVKDVYKIEDLISADQIGALKETTKNVLETEDFENYIEISEYIKKKIITLKASDDVDKVEKCCILLFTDCLVRYLTAPYKQVVGSKYVLCSYSDSINNAVLDAFSMFNEKGRTRPQHLKDKAVCHIIVLLLLYSNYTIDDSVALSKEIRTPSSKLSQMCKVVGAHYVGDSKKSSIVLKLPLSAPPVINKRRSTK